MKANNINRLEETDCSCGSWIEHWARFSGQEPTYCPVADCLNPIAVGAHVQKEGGKDLGWYILPFCHKHDGMIGESLEVNEHVEWVPADVKKTCGKKT